MKNRYYIFHCYKSFQCYRQTPGTFLLVFSLLKLCELKYFSSTILNQCDSPNSHEKVPAFITVSAQILLVFLLQLVFVLVLKIQMSSLPLKKNGH